MLKKQSYWLAISYVFFVLLSFGALKFNLNSFGTHQYGIWLMLSSIWGFGSSLDLGIGFSMIKFISEYKDNDKSKLTGLFSSSLFILFFFGIVIYSSLYCLGNYYYFEHGNIWSSNFELTEFKKIFIVLSVIFIVRYYMGFFKGVLEGFGHYVLTSKMGIIQNVITFLIASIIWFFKKEMIYLVIMNLILSLVILSVYLSFVIIKYKQYLKISCIKIKHLKDLFKFSLSIQMMNVFAGLIDPVVKFIVGNYYKVDTVSLYEIAKKIASSISGLFTASFRNTLNDITVLKQNSEMDFYLNNQCLKLSKLGVVYSGISFGSMTIVMIFILRFFFNYEGIEIVYIMLSLCETINIFVFPLYIFLAGVGKALWLAFVQCLNVILTAIFLYLGLVTFNNLFGFLGLFFSVVLLNSLTFYYIWHNYKFNLTEYLKKSLFYRLVIMTFMLLICIVFAEKILIPSLLLISIIIISTHRFELANMYKQLLAKSV